MSFYQKVLITVKKIPKGSVATYGQLAAIVGNPRAAQAVGWALHSMDSRQDIPWQRVVASSGYITTTCPDHTFKMQKNMLKKEGVKAVWDKKKKMYLIDLKKYLWAGK